MNRENIIDKLELKNKENLTDKNFTENIAPKINRNFDDLKVNDDFSNEEQLKDENQ